MHPQSLAVPQDREAAEISTKASFAGKDRGLLTRYACTACGTSAVLPSWAHDNIWAFGLSRAALRFY